MILGTTKLSALVKRSNMRKNLKSQLLEAYLFEFHILLGDLRTMSSRDRLEMQEDRAVDLEAALERCAGLKKRMARGE